MLLAFILSRGERGTHSAGRLGAVREVVKFALTDEAMGFQEGKGLGAETSRARGDRMGKGVEKEGHQGVCKRGQSGPNEA